MNTLFFRVCVSQVLLLVLLFVALWLGVPWRAVWWAVCGAGVLWCAYTAWGQVRRKGGRLQSWLFPAALVQTGLWGLALGLTVDTDTTASRPLGDAVGTASGIAIFVLLLTGLVGFGGLAVRMLRSNQAVQLQPRRAMWGAVLLVCNAVGWTFVISISFDLTRQKSNLSVVNYLATNDLQVFTRGRYTRELLSNHYIWMDDPDAPPLGWWPFAGAMADPDDLIRKHAHPKDRFSGAYALTDERKENDRSGKQHAFGLSLADELERPVEGTSPLAAAATKSLDVPEPSAPPNAKTTPTRQPSGSRVTDVRVGSPAALAGVQRGDMLVAVNGVPWAQWRTALNNMPASKATTSLSILNRSGMLITLNKRATFADTGVQQVVWLANKVLYVRLNGFKEDTAVYMTKELRELELSGNSPLKGLSGLVIDLRGNPGGRTRTAEAIGRQLFGASLATQPVDTESQGVAVKGQALIYTRQVGEQRGGVLRKHNWTQDKRHGAPLLPALRQVFLLTNSDSCSASEYLIHGLRTLTDVDVVTVGGTTCGKPYGYEPREYAGYRFAVMDMAFESLNGQTVYPSGIEPTCKVIDPIAVPFTALGDTVLEAAIYYAQNRRCP